MASNEDSRPFTVLRQSADDFQASFDNDIKKCLNLLDSKLTTLICDPDSMGSPSKDARRLSAHLEFTKAKYEIFMFMKSLIEEMDESWKIQLTEMKDNFLENVEILLASTRLEALPQIGNKKPSSPSKNQKGQHESSSLITSTISPYSLLSTAKRIPVLNSFLSKNDEMDNGEECGASNSSLSVNVKKTGRFQTSSQQSHKTTTTYNSSQRRNAFPNIHVVDDDDDDETSEEDNEVRVVSTSSKPSGIFPARRSNVHTSQTMKDVAVKLTSLRKKPDGAVVERPASRRAAVVAAKNIAGENPVSVTPQKKNDNKGRKSILKVDLTNENELHSTPSRSTRKRTAIKETNQTGNINENEKECSESDYEVSSATPKTPKNVHFSVGLDIHDDLEIYSPAVNLTRSAPRRKTIVTDLMDCTDDTNQTRYAARSKRKTIGGSAMDVSVAPSPKRFKRGSRASTVPAISEEAEESDHLESDGSSVTEHYTPWIYLDDLDSKVPNKPGVYEVKVYKAKKTAYIGSCDNLLQKLTLHKIGQNSGHKHLDKFLERNKNDVQVRYEKMPSAAQAKNEEMNRIKAFVSQHKTTPAYN